MDDIESRIEAIEAVEICDYLTQISRELDSMDLGSIRGVLMGTPLGENEVNGICRMLENSRDFLFIENARISGVLGEDLKRLKDIGFL